MLTATAMPINRIRIHIFSTNRNTEIKILVHNKEITPIFVGKEIALYF